MLTKRIIPCLDIKDGRTVKGVNFLGLMDAGDPVELAQRYSNEGADELIFLDISATQEKRRTLVKLVQRIAEVITIPFTVGGGIKSVEEIETLLKAGADKVSLNSSIIQRPELITEASQAFGAQAIVAAIDMKRVERWTEENPKWVVYTHGGIKRTDINALEWAKDTESLGAGELLVTSMDRDGTQVGYDIDLMAKISSKVNIPVIASGGVGKLDHLVEGIKLGKVSAVLAASIFHYGKYSVKEAKDYLDSKGIPVRI